MKNNVVFPGISADLASIEQALPLDKRMARMPTEEELSDVPKDTSFEPTGTESLKLSWRLGDSYGYSSDDEYGITE